MPFPSLTSRVHICQCYLFVNRMLETLKAVHDYGSHPIGPAFRADLHWILQYLPLYNSVQMIPRSPTLDTSIAVDSCLTGGGGHFGPHIYHTVYQDFILQLGFNISELEMMNAVIAIKLWAPMLRNHVIRLQCDNSAAVSVLQTGRGRASFLLSCAPQVRAYTAQYKFEIRMEHIAGANNTLADQLSRYHSGLSCLARVDALIASTKTILHPVDAHLFKLAECFQDVWSLVRITHFVTDIITLSLLYIALVFCSGSTLPSAWCKAAHLLCIPPRYQGQSTMPD